MTPQSHEGGGPNGRVPGTVLYDEWRSLHFDITAIKIIASILFRNGRRKSIRMFLFVWLLLRIALLSSITITIESARSDTSRNESSIIIYHQSSSPSDTESVIYNITLKQDSPNTDRRGSILCHQKLNTLLSPNRSLGAALLVFHLARLRPLLTHIYTVFVEFNKEISSNCVAIETP